LKTPERSGPQTNCIPARAAAEFRFRDALGSAGGRGQRITYLRAAGAGDAIEGLDSTPDLGYSYGKELIKRNVPFTAMVAYNDISAIGAMNSGLKV
jgi:DNA-binding LacI/PurR family transcriptional regulator